MIILGIFFIYKLQAPPKTWGSKPTCPEEQSKGTAIKSQMSQILLGYSLSRKQDSYMVLKTGKSWEFQLKQFPARKS